MKFSLILVLFISCLSCSSSPEKTEIEKYVFLDDADVIHIDENCTKLKFGKNRHGHSIYAKECIDTAALIYIERVCSRCVNSEIFERLEVICKRNKERDINRKWLYNKFKEANYDLEEYEVFFEILKDPIKRRNAYRNALIENWNVGNYEEFCKLLGYTIEE